MPRNGIALILSVVTTWAASAAFAGYDFEPPTPRWLARFFGIGPGPGYHSVPCTPHEWRHFRDVTHGFSGMPVESDYRPNTFSAYSPWIPTTNAPASTNPSWLTPPSTPKANQGDTTPTPAPRPNEAERRDNRSAPRQMERIPSSATEDNRESTERTFGTLLDELLKEQEEDMEEAGNVLKELQPPSPSDEAPETPTNPDPESTTSRSKPWW